MSYCGESSQNLARTSNLKIVRDACHCSGATQIRCQYIEYFCSGCGFCSLFGSKKEKKDVLH